TISAWRVSRLNIVSAIRDLPEYQARKEGKRGLILGILGILAGAGIAWLGISGGASSGFSGGVSVALIGLTLVIRWALRRRGTRPELRDRIAFTFGGIALMVWWLIPFDTFESVLPKMSGGIEGFFLSGVMLVAGAIWTVIFNYDILLMGLTRTVGRIGSLGPVLKTAVSYPMTYKFRTGLTLAMFSLIVFTLIVMTVMINTTGQTLQAVDTITGGYQLKAQVSYNNPIEDINASIASSKDLQANDFEAIGAQTNLPIQARQVGASNQTYEPYYANLADDAYLDSTGYRLVLKADGFKTDREVWESLKTHPEYAIVDSLIVPTTMMSAVGATPVKFKLEGFYLQDKKLPFTQIEVKETRTGYTTKYTVVGVVEQATNAFGIYASHSGIAKASPTPVPFTTYFVKLKPGVAAAQASQALESQFLEHGFQSTVLADEIKKQNSTNNSMNLLMEGFMALGLLVGVAALGVISMRAVVERRQEIGVLRAIGYQPRMVQLSFLTESSFVTLLGVAIGVALGLGLSYNLVNFMAKEMPMFRFEIPWLSIILIVAISYVVSLSTTYLPSRQAARIYPAEALRYE
ncbi:MAG: FtsX-like permease family protein, partial [Chloroflexi bacterium]|nr:FtsX-like permease family protein [Chloroflexota bacterium]